MSFSEVTASWSEPLLDQIVVKMVSLVEEQVVEPVIVKKKNKKRKLKNEAPAAENALDENFNPDVKQKKKKKKNKENIETVAEESVAPAEEEPVKKKKKKSKEKPTVSKEDETKDSEDSGDAEDAGPFKKKFYSMRPETEAMTKAEVKSYQAEHNITMYGKGRKTFKPLRTFKELGLSECIMKVTSGFKSPTPIQVLRYRI